MGKIFYSSANTCIDSWAFQLFTPVLVKLKAHGDKVLCSIWTPHFESIFYIHTLSSEIARRTYNCLGRERKLVEWQFFVLVRFLQQWYAWGTNGRKIQVDNSCAKLILFDNGYHHQFWWSVEPLSAVLTFYFQIYHWRLQPTRIHKIAPILAKRVYLKWRAVGGKI